MRTDPEESLGFDNRIPAPTTKDCLDLWERGWNERRLWELAAKLEHERDMARAAANTFRQCAEVTFGVMPFPRKFHWENTPAHPPTPFDPRFARFGEAMWKYITKRGGDFCNDEISEDILPLAEAAGLCCRAAYDPKIHGDMIDAEPGCEIWWWGNF